MTKIKKILITTHFTKSIRGLLVMGSLALASCASLPGGPNFVPKASIETMAETAWADLKSKTELSSDAAATNRFNSIAKTVIAASDLSDEVWDVKLFDTTGSNVFTLPGNRLGGYGIDDVSDDQLASMVGFGVASQELEHVRQMVSRHMAGSLLYKLNASDEDKHLRNLSSLGPLPPTADMRREATDRAREIVQKAGFKADFLFSSDPLNLHGPVK